MSNILILGANAFSTMATMELLKRKIPTNLTMIDRDARNLETTLDKLDAYSSHCPLKTQVWDVVSNPTGLRKFFEKADIVLNSLPYRFTLEMTQLALETNTHYVDFGGPTKIIQQQLNLSLEHANSQSLNIVPDCGFIPGLGATLAAYLINQIGFCDFIKIYSGNLPAERQSTLHFSLPHGLEHLINSYFGQTEVIKNGKISELKAFSHIEKIEIKNMPKCEAFLTSGMSGTCPNSFKEMTNNFFHKTIRHKGHYTKFKFLRDFGFLDIDPITINNQSIIPRQFFNATIKPRIIMEEMKDVALLRIVAINKTQTKQLELNLTTTADSENGFTAYEKLTGLTASLVIEAISVKKITPGPRPLEQTIDAEWFWNSLKNRGLAMDLKESPYAN